MLKALRGREEASSTFIYSNKGDNCRESPLRADTSGHGKKPSSKNGDSGAATFAAHPRSG